MVEVKKSVTILRTPDEVYAYWRDVEHLPQFMYHLESVTVGPGTTSHWKAKAPAGTTVEWDAEITEDQPNQLIAWRSLDGATVPNAGVVSFERGAGRARHRGQRRVAGTTRPEGRSAPPSPSCSARSRGSKCTTTCAASSRCWKPAKSSTRTPAREGAARGVLQRPAQPLGAEETS